VAADAGADPGGCGAGTVAGDALGDAGLGEVEDGAGAAGAAGVPDVIGVTSTPVTSPFTATAPQRDETVLAGRVRVLAPKEPDLFGSGAVPSSRRASLQVSPELCRCRRKKHEHRRARGEGLSHGLRQDILITDADQDMPIGECERSRRRAGSEILGGRHQAPQPSDLMSPRTTGSRGGTARVSCSLSCSLKLVIEPVFEADFDEAAYGYRPGRSAEEAIRRVHGALWQNHSQVIDADLSKYFDTIPTRR
jgi:hypothetical protein